MTLVATGETGIGSLDLDMLVEAAPGETLAVIGPNGAGKTTLLRTIAGLHGLRSGQLVINGLTCDEPPTKTWVEPEHRGIGYQFQEPLLFDHLDVLANVAFGLRSRGRSRREAEAIGRDVLAELGIGELAPQRPAALSGGQAQRVAMARVLATSPALLLLDEPAAALDTSGRSDMRSLVGDLDITTLVVSHDPIDVWALADRVVLVSDGRADEVGAPSQLLDEPPTPFVADLFGANVLHGTATGHAVRLDSGFELATSTPASGSVFVMFSPQAVALHTERPDTSARNVWSARILGQQGDADVVRLHLGEPIPAWAAITPASAAALGLAPGVTCWASLKATEVTVRSA